MNLRRRRSKRRVLPEVSLTPLVDTALVLLVIFMIATPIMQNSLHIDLPQGQMQEDTQQSSQPVMVTIDSQERLSLNGDVLDLDRILQVLGEKMKSSDDKKVIVECDQKASSGKLVETIDGIKFVAGVEHVVLSTKRAH